MSYTFSDALLSRMSGTFASTYGDPITLGAFIKVTPPVSVVDYILSLGLTSGSINDAYFLRSSGTANQWQMQALNSAGTGAPASFTVDVGTGWVGLIGRVAATDTSRSLSVGDILNADTNTTDILVSDLLNLIRVGRSMANANYFTGLIAEVAIWNANLSTDDATSFLDGTGSELISAANLIGYWPLDEDLSPQPNLGVDTGGDLTVTNATFNADHPIIDHGISSAPAGRMLLTGIG